MVLAYTFIKTELDMTVSMKMTKKKVTGFIIGLMAENTKVGGTKESSMVWVLTLIAQKTA